MPAGNPVTGTGARILGLVLGLISCVLVAGWAIVSALGERDGRVDAMTNAQSAAIVADFDHWLPPDTVGRTWSSADRTIGADRPKNCGHPISWTWANTLPMTLDLVRLDCKNPYAAYDVEDNYAGQIQQISLPASGTNYVRVYSSGNQAQLVWRQRATMLALNLTCPGLNPAACLDDARALTGAVDDIEPSVRKTDATVPSGFNYLITPLAFWLVLVAPVRAVQFVRTQRWDSVDGPPRYHDVTARVRSMRWSRIGRLALWWIAGLLGAIAVLVFLDVLLVGTGGSPVAGFICAAGAAACYIAGRRVDRYQRRRNQSFTRDTGPRGRIGMALSWWSATLTAATISTYVIIVLAGGIGRQASLDRLFYSVNQSANDASPSGTLRWIFGSLAVGYRNNVSAAIVFVVLPAFVFAYVMRTFGQRFRVADAIALRKADCRPHFLYLRSFDEDRLKLAAPSVRQGALERLIPWRRRSFERVLVETLSRYGPVVAISDPRVRMAPIGAARESVPHEYWQQTVQLMAHDSLVVVVGGTPTEVRKGLAYELSMLAAIPAPRLLVVQAPYRRPELTRRWHGFLRQTVHLPLFSPLSGPWVQEGTLLATFDHLRGWTAWGARKRTDRSYTAAIDAALAEEIPIWSDAYWQAHSNHTVSEVRQRWS